MITPIDPKTGLPRKGKWVNRIWEPEVPEEVKPLPQSNDTFPTEFRLGKNREEFENKEG